MIPGIYPGMPLPDYHAAPGFSKSDLDRLARSPAHYRCGPVEPTPALRLGTAVHACVLEPETWEARYTGANGRRKAAAASDRTVLSAADWETCLRLRDAIWNHPTCQDLFEAGHTEHSAWWIDPDTLLLCKCRPDWSRPGLLVDLKTTIDASPAGFARAVERYRYHVQAAYALDGWPDAAFGGSARARRERAPAPERFLPGRRWEREQRGRDAKPAGGESGFSEGGSSTDARLPG